MKDYYKVLQVNRTAGQDEIKKSFRKLAKKFHPDVNPGNLKAEEVFKEINEAYAVLSDDSKKSEYDGRLFGGFTETQTNRKSAAETGTAYHPRQNMSAKDFAGAKNAFEDFFGFDPKSDSPTLKKKKQDVKPVKTSDVYEALFGKKRF